MNATTVEKMRAGDYPTADDRDHASGSAVANGDRYGSELAVEYHSYRFCRSGRRAMMGAIVLSALGQLFIDSSPDNLLCVAIVVFTSLLTWRYVAVGSVVRATPLPAFAVLAYNVATMTGALLVQTANGTSLIFNLQVPEATFGCLALYQLSLLAAFAWFASSKALIGMSGALRRAIVAQLRLFDFPSEFQLWIMGGIGCVALVWMSFSISTGGVQSGDVGGKLIYGFAPLAYAPFLIPLSRAYSDDARCVEPSSRRVMIALISFAALLVLLGIMRNSRGTFATGCANLVLGALLGMAVGQVRLSRRFRNRLLAGTVAFMAMAPIVSDVALAMVIAREYRGNVSSTELLRKTWGAFEDKQELADYRKRISFASYKDGYEETYVGNPFAARFIMTKFSDNVLSYRSLWQPNNRAEVWAVTGQKILALLPTPLLSLLGSHLNKDDLGFSMGDYFYYVDSGVGMGGYRTGSSVGHGIALMGSLCFVAIIPLSIIVMILIQQFATTKNGRVIVAPVILMQIMSMYYLFAGDSLLEPFTLAIRGLPQSMFIYLVLYHLSAITERMLSSRRRRNQRTGRAR